MNDHSDAVDFAQKPKKLTENDTFWNPGNDEMVQARAREIDAPAQAVPLDIPVENINNQRDKFVAVMSCPNPKCGTVGFVTQLQCAGILPMICGSNTCSWEWFFITHENGDPGFIRRAPM